MDRRPRIGVIGCGYWGPNIVRTFLEIPDVELVAVADRDPARLDHLRTRHPQLGTLVHDHTELFDLGLDAVAVATPPQTHHAVVSECLTEGLDVLVEKPLAISTTQARSLARQADDADRVLMVGHIGAYHPAIRHIKAMTDLGELGPMRYIDAVRAGLGKYHASLNVIWDLAPHDIAILSYLLDEAPDSVSTRGVACVRDTIEDIAYLTLTYPSGVLGHIRMSWLDPCKTRRITLVGSAMMAVYDDLEPLEKVKVYDKHVDASPRTDTFGDFQFAYHYGSVVSPYIAFEEPLRLECQHFLECVRERRRPLTDGWNGVEVVEVVEAAQRSLRAGGVQVPVREPDRRPVGVARALHPPGGLEGGHVNGVARSHPTPGAVPLTSHPS